MTVHYATKTGSEFIETFNSLNIHKKDDIYEVRVNLNTIAVTDDENYVNYIKSRVSSALETNRPYLDLKYKLTLYNKEVKYEG